jgi:hypothetical protein
MKYSIPDRLELARLVIDGGLADNSITQQTALYGFDCKACQQARKLYDKAYGLQTTKEQEVGTQRDTTQARKAAQTEANRVYQQHLTIARMAIPRTVGELLKKLGLGGRQESTLTGWLNQVNKFYQNVDQIQEVMARNNVLLEELQHAQAQAQAQAQVQAVAAMQVEQNRTRCQSQQSREQRDASLQKLE